MGHGFVASNVLIDLDGFYLRFLEERGPEVVLQFRRDRSRIRARPFD
jgi:hypothetical protein